MNQKDSPSSSESTSQHTHTLVKQYEIVLRMADSEMGRAWTRFNIFISLQWAAVIGIIVSLESLLLSVAVFRALIVFFGVLSLLFSIVVFRGILTVVQLTDLVAYLESRSDELVPLVQLSKKHSRLPQYINNIITLIISLLFFAGWTTALVYLEMNSYRVAVP